LTPSERKEYWRALLELMNVRARQPYSETWQIIDDWPEYSIRSAARLNSDEHWIHVDLTLLGPNREEWFDTLEMERGPIQRELSALIAAVDQGAKLKWEKSAPNHPKECWIYLRIPEDPTHRTRRHIQHEWLARVLVAFRSVFGERINRW
jgi:uncharacterized protein DUF4268